MRNKGVLCLGMMVLLIILAGALAQADNGGYIVRPAPPGASNNYPGVDREVSFWELPLWIQMSYFSGAIAALIVAVKVVPFALLKLKVKLSNKNRESIYRHINDNPGCTVTDISKHEEMNVGSVRYHVEQLQDARRIVLVKMGKFMRLFRNSGAYDEREIAVISALHLRTSRAIVFLIRDRPGLSNKQIAELLNIKESMAHTYLSGLLKNEIIRYEKNGQQKMYYLENDVEAILAKVSNVPAGQNNSAMI
ncbi:MAG TPA: winged helix-turn-helix transcriptional regulator [Methanocella sp.]|jgi:predicted transcriptional regulator